MSQPLTNPQDVAPVSLLQNVCEQLKTNLSTVILGKTRVIEQLLVALFSGGNILLEDVPGVGKTTLAKALAKSLDIEFNRIQFTPDLLPTDILGGSIYNPQTGEFTFRPGPVFTNILLADEINRASPRTQSALLEAMTEGQVTVEGVRRELPRPFIVIATQNPVEFHGTYPLPEAQLDRFMVLLDIGYPDHADELDMLYSQQACHPLSKIEPVTDGLTLQALQQAVREVGVEKSVAEYVLKLTHATRNDSRICLGASPRASLMLFRAAQAQAFLRQRDYVIPDDVRDVVGPVLGHRIVLDNRTSYSGTEKALILKEILSAVAVPV